MAQEAASAVGAPLIISESPHTVAEARNNAVKRMLDSIADYLFMVDDDVVIPPDAISMLRELDAPIAAGCVPICDEMIYLNVAMKREGTTVWCTDWFDGPKRVELVGTGCILIERSVLKGVGFPWFRWPTDWEQEPTYTTDDTDFCNRVDADIWAHGDVRCGHYKRVDLKDFM
jgi:hypothetical protein